MKHRLQAANRAEEQMSDYTVGLAAAGKLKAAMEAHGWVIVPVPTCYKLSTNGNGAYRYALHVTMSGGRAVVHDSAVGEWLVQAGLARKWQAAGLYRIPCLDGASHGRDGYGLADTLALAIWGLRS